MGLFDNMKKKFDDMNEQSKAKKADKAIIKQQMNAIKDKIQNKEPITEEEKEFFRENSLLHSNSVEQIATANIKKHQVKTINEIKKQYASVNKNYFINKDEHYLYLKGTYPIFFAEIINFNLDIDQETKTKGTSTGKSSGGMSLGKAAVGGFLLGPTGAIIGGTTGKKKSKSDYDLTSFTEVKSYNISISTLDHGFLKFTFGPKDKALVENLLYWLDYAKDQQIDIEEERELYLQNTGKKLSQLEDEYRELGYL